MKRRTSLLALLLPLFVVVACDDGGDPTGTTADLAGTYDLVSYDGEDLPYTEDFGECTDEETLEDIPNSSDLAELQSAVLVLRTNNTFELTWTSREGCRGSTGTMIRDWETIVDTNEGTYARSGSRVTFEEVGLFELEGTVSGSSITIEGFLEFEKR